MSEKFLGRKWENGSHSLDCQLNVMLSMKSRSELTRDCPMQMQLWPEVGQRHVTPGTRGICYICDDNVWEALFFFYSEIFLTCGWLHRTHTQSLKKAYKATHHVTTTWSTNRIVPIPWNPSLCSPQHKLLHSSRNKNSLDFFLFTFHLLSSPA